LEENTVNRTLLLAATLCLVLSVSAHAALVINVGTIWLDPDLPNQERALSVTGGDPVQGFNLRAQIGDGTGPNPEPVFQSIDFTGGIWDGHAKSVGGGPVAGAPQYAQAWVALNTQNDTTSANGVLVKLIIDTTGLHSGNFGLLLAGTDIGEDSDFAPLSATITNGTLTILPEPATFGLLALGGIGCMFTRRRKTR
jgi:hypothetical protein